MHDVVIVGAGPAGLYTALRLAGRGYDVVVLEEHQAVGQPVHCTGVIAREAFDEFALSPDTVLNELTTARFISPSGLDVFYRSGRAEAVVIDREAFDLRLAEQAVGAGARIVCGARAEAIRADRDGVSVALARRPVVRARACVLACGGRYGLHRQLDLGRPSLFLMTTQREFPAARAGDVELYFGAGVAPKGFGWAVPVCRDGRPHVRIGVMCDTDAPHYFDRMVDRVGRRWGVSPEAGCPPRQKVLPLTTVRRTFGDRLLVVGDAAGLVKPTTGGGVYYSLVSAALAADVLSGALTRDELGAASLAEYERRWRARFDAELAAQLTLRAVAQRMSDADIENLFELARTDGVMPIVRRTASVNRHRKLILALFRHPPARAVLFRSFIS